MEFEVTCAGGLYNSRLTFNLAYNNVNFLAVPVLVLKPELPKSKQLAPGSSGTRAVEQSQLHSKVTGKNKPESSENVRV